MNEEEFLKALGVDPEYTIIVSIPVIACGQEDPVYGHTYLTKKGVIVFEEEKQKIFWTENPNATNPYVDFFLKHSDIIKLKNLENTINNNPEAFDPKRSDSVYTIYPDTEIVPAFDNYHAIIMQNLSFFQGFSFKKLNEKIFGDKADEKIYN
ncbi:MAG: hypothetical protein ABIC91_08520 [Nanoarchaeota archaeon]|nr:hypothetical protein [Nanoarchaeota archaeon]MBU1030320.1 hypothetical protein [Nanoarchaeota archaeon]MBU1849101.1 hypothetical protein [Nanoarchaeota archaeon]